MAKELIDILTRAAEVRDETGAAENTASKVGGILTDLIDLIGESILSAGLSFNVSANGITLVVKQYDDEGRAFNTEIPFSMASATNAGAITAAQLTNLTNFIVSLAIVGPNSVTLQYTKPLTGDIKSIPINGATKNLAGVMTAAQVQVQEEHAKRIMKTIGINELDTLTTIPIANTGAADYWLTHNDIIVGRLFMFEDSMFHKSTQIVICNNYVEGFPTGGHYKEGLSIYYRFYGHNSTDVPQGAWTAWKRLFDSEIPDILDMGIVSTSSVAEERAVELAGNKDIHFMRYETSNGQIGTIRQVYSYDGYSMQYLTLNGTEFVRVVYYDSGMKSVWRNINKASIVYKLLYDTGSRALSFHDPIHDEGFGGITLPLASASNAGLLTNTQYQKLSAFNIYEGTPGADKVPVIFTNPLTGTTTTFNLMGATTARAGMMTTAHLRTLNDLTKNIYYLGDFTGGQSTSNAAAEAAKKDVVSNPFIVVMYYTSWEADGGVIFQQVGQGQTLQYKFENGTRWTRYIKFNNSGVTEVQPWQRDGVRNLAYNNSTRVLTLQDMHSNNVGSTATLPVGTSSVHGLLKLGTTAGTAYDGAAGKALADRITALETQLTNLAQS